MKTMSKKKVSADEIGEMAMRGEDISRFFTGKGKMMPPMKMELVGVQRVNVDFSMPMLAELDALTHDLNISRQAVIKSLLRQGLDQHYLAKKKRLAAR